VHAWGHLVVKFGVFGEIEAFSNVLGEDHQKVIVPSAAQLDFLTADPLEEIGAGVEKMGVHRVETLESFTGVLDVIGKCQGEKTDMADRGGKVDQPFAVQKKGVRLLFVIRGEKLYKGGNNFDSFGFGIDFG